MIEIIPNWHPVFVHFTVALFSLAVLLFAVAPIMKPPLREHWGIVARWALWFGAGFTILTGLTGLYAYNTVAHDTPSHAAMTDHRNWAIATIVLFLGMAAWSVVRARRSQALGAVFIAAMLVAGGVLASTAWRGGEVVYRYGLGVTSLPRSEGEGHAHEHAEGSAHGRGETPGAGGAGNVDSHAADNHPHQATEATASADDNAVKSADHHDDGHDHEGSNHKH